MSISPKQIRSKNQNATHACAKSKVRMQKCQISIDENMAVIFVSFSVHTMRFTAERQSRISPLKLAIKDTLDDSFRGSMTHSG